MDAVLAMCDVIVSVSSGPNSMHKMRSATLVELSQILSKASSPEQQVLTNLHMSRAIRFSFCPSSSAGGGIHTIARRRQRMPISEV
jgi:hypothetical protein